MRFSKSKKLYSRAARAMAGGVSSPVRAFKAVGGDPLFIRRGSGQWIWDADGNRLLDYVCSWGALILGHANPCVVAEAVKAVKSGSSFGAPNVPELMLAEKICERIRSIEKVRFVNSGTEATMSALRLSRAYTKRRKIIKFEGCYHGHADAFLAGAGSGLATLGIPASRGVLQSTTNDTVTVPYNDARSLESAFKSNGGEVAAVIIEPVVGNMGVVPPNRGFLNEVHGLCKENGALLIFDEVITGFRVGVGGAQKLYGIKPDITCLGKIIGGGFPVGAYGARKEIMGLVSPEGPVYQAGTLSGNPVAMAAGLAVLSRLNAATYRKLERVSAMLEQGLTDAAGSAGVQVRVNRVGSMLSMFFTGNGVTNFSEAKAADQSSFRRFFWGMINCGVYLPPSGLESWFVSSAHSEDDVRKTIEAAADAFKGL